MKGFLRACRLGAEGYGGGEKQRRVAGKQNYHKINDFCWDYMGGFFNIRYG